MFDHNIVRLDVIVKDFSFTMQTPVLFKLNTWEKSYIDRIPLVYAIKLQRKGRNWPSVKTHRITSVRQLFVFPWIIPRNINIHGHWTRITPLNPLWIGGDSLSIQVAWIFKWLLKRYYSTVLNDIFSLQVEPAYSNVIFSKCLRSMWNFEFTIFSVFMGTNIERKDWKLFEFNSHGSLTKGNS